ncbi:MAG TPA: lipoate--protein ligase family protein [Gemmataceae bacterium]|nr:lipoate--protein ligase family protein [Gemmataceae bacterium]
MEAPINSVRLLPFATADGPHNMAADEALLESAIAGRASLRFYGWAEPTLSLGYFQPQSVRSSDPQLSALAWMRRPTGGAALVHHHELTYAVALPSGLPWQTPGESWLARMHAIIAEALSASAALPESVLEESKFGEILCFLHHTPGDLRIGRTKVVGSAQRRQRGALLQHGAILLAGSPLTPALPGIAELCGRRQAAEEVAAAVRSAFARRTGWPLEQSDWTPEERRRIDLLATEKYGSASWNAKR